MLNVMRVVGVSRWCDRGSWFIGYAIVVHSVNGHTYYLQYMLPESINTNGDYPA